MPHTTGDFCNKKHTWYDAVRYIKPDTQPIPWDIIPSTWRNRCLAKSIIKHTQHPAAMDSSSSRGEMSGLKTATQFCYVGWSGRGLDGSQGVCETDTRFSWFVAAASGVGQIAHLEY